MNIFRYIIVLIKIRSKNSWNWLIIFVPATVWRVLNMTGNGNYLNILKLFPILASFSNPKCGKSLQKMPQASLNNSLFWSCHHAFSQSFFSAISASWKSPKSLYIKSRGELFSWSKNWDLGWFGAGLGLCLGLFGAGWAVCSFMNLLYFFIYYFKLNLVLINKVEKI